MKRVLFFAFVSLVLMVQATGCSMVQGDKDAALIEALDNAYWDSSEWISVVDAPIVTGAVSSKKNNRSADGASCFLSEVTVPKKVASAKWMTTGLGVYYLYVNGNLIGKEILKPGFTHPEKTKYSFTYDITDVFKLKSGDVNTLFAQVTPGWWADKIVTPGGYEGMRGKKCAFRGVLELTFEDGTKEVYGTNTEDWKAGIAGPVQHAGIFDGEEYDARELPGYLTPEKLSTPEVNTEFLGEILPSAGAEIYLRNDIALKPVVTYVWSEIEGQTEEEYGKVVISRNYKAGDFITLDPGETLVVDFGQNASAVPSFVFKAAEGTILTCLPGEILNDGNGAKSRGMDGPEGSVHRENLRIPSTGLRVVYTFGPDKGFVSYHPQCTFFGYRYVSITTTERVEIRDIKSIPVSSISAELEIGKIKTGDDSVNRLISNIYWGQLSNYLSVPTDCPQRDERLGWTADTQVFAETGAFFANTLTFFHKWMRDMRDSQSETGAFPAVAPLAQYGNEMMRLGWADAGVIVPWIIWKQFADTQIVSENWEAMERYMSHVNDTRYDHKLLAEENRNYQYADWLSYEPLESWGRGAFNHDVSPVQLYPEAIEYWCYLSSCYWAIDAGMMHDMATAIGKDASVYEEMYANAKSYIKETFFTPEGLFKTDILNTMQTPALFALKVGVMEGVAKENMINRLRQNFVDHGNCLQTGFLGTSILMPTLTENGMVDIAYELLFQRKNPSWLYSVDNGATTIWERWNSYMIEKGMAPNGMNSFNHYAYGCVGEWIWETVAGIASDPSDPGFKTIIMRPIPDKRLGYVEAEYQSAAGLIKSSWKYLGNNWTWTFTIPEGSKALVTLPGETEVNQYDSGTHKVKIENL